MYDFCSWEAIVELNSVDESYFELSYSRDPIMLALHKCSSPKNAPMTAHVVSAGGRKTSFMARSSSFLLRYSGLEAYHLGDRPRSTT